MKKDEIIKLNVGGEKEVMVTRSMMCQVKGSTLEAMFSGRHPLKKVNKQQVYINRNWNEFRHVLTYLRQNQQYTPKHLSPDE